MSACRSCGDDIVWAVTETGRRMPLDAKPVAGGLFVMVGGKARKATAEDDRLHRDRYTSHFATCAQADDWRQPR